MACYDVDISTSTPEGIPVTFDFDQWVDENGLSCIKDLLYKHQLNTMNALSLTSHQYIQLMSDPQLLKHKSHLIPKLLKAIQSINTENTINSTVIVISETEHGVIDKLKANLNELDDIDTHFDQLKLNYPQSIQRMKNGRYKQIQSAKQQLMITFNNLKDALNIRQQYLLKKLDQINENDDIKEFDLFKESDDIIMTQKQKLKNNLKLCNDTIHRYKNENIKQRKETISMIGKQYDQEFNLATQRMKEIQKLSEDLIEKNNQIEHIHYNQNQSTYNKLLNKINDFGSVNVTEKGIKQDIDHDEDDVLINDLKEENKKYKQSVDVKNHQITTLQKQMNSAVKSLTFKVSSPYRWYHEQKEECISVVKIIDIPSKCINADGVIMNICMQNLSLEPTNLNKINTIGSYFTAIMKKHFDACLNRPYIWEHFDDWDINYKGKLQLKNDTIISERNGYQSFFGTKICLAPFKYHWKLKQIARSDWDFYVGIEQKGAEIINDYFCKSKTSYAFSGYHAQLYAADKWGRKYGKHCYKCSDFIDVYLDLENNTLSYGTNGEKHGVAYNVNPGKYKLAVSVRGNRKLKLVSSTKQD